MRYFGLIIFFLLNSVSYAYASNKGFCSDLGLPGTSGILEKVGVPYCQLSDKVGALINNKGNLDYYSRELCFDSYAEFATDVFNCHTGTSLKSIHIEESVNKNTQKNQLVVFSTCPLGSKFLINDKGESVCWINWNKDGTIFSQWISSSNVYLEVNNISTNTNSLILVVKSAHDCPANTTIVDYSTYKCKVNDVLLKNRSILYSNNLGVAISYPKDDLEKKCNPSTIACEYPTDQTWSRIDIVYK